MPSPVLETGWRIRQTNDFISSPFLPLPLRTLCPHFTFSKAMSMLSEEPLLLHLHSKGSLSSPLSVSKPLAQFSSVTQSCLTLCDPMNCSTPGLPVHQQLLELPQTHGHRVGDAIQPFNPLSSPSPLAFNLSQHQGLFQGVSSSN